MPCWNLPAIDVGRGSAYKEVAEAMITSLDELQPARDSEHAIFMAERR